MGQIFMDYLVGLLIGVLCGAIPFIFGWFAKHKILGFIGGAAAVLSGPLFVLIGKSPFTAIGIAAIFSIFIFAKLRSINKNHNEDDDE